MKEDEMIKDIYRVLIECCNYIDDNNGLHGNKCGNCEFWDDTNNVCASYERKQSIAIYNAGYRKIGEDEIVVKKSGYEELSKDYATINNEAYYCGFSVGVEEAKQDTAREIFEEILKCVDGLEYRANTQRKTVNVEELKAQCDWLIHKVVSKTIKDLAKEKGIELE